MDLENVPLQVADVGDVIHLIVVHHIMNADLTQLVLNVRIQGNNLAVLHVGDGEVLGGDGGSGQGIRGQEIVQAVYQPGIGAPVCICAVGFINIDGILSLAALIGAGLLGHLNEVGGGEDVVRVIQIHQADGAHIGVHGDHIGAQLHGGIGVAGEVLYIPDLILVADKHTGGLAGTNRVEDVQQ